MNVPFRSKITLLLSVCLLFSFPTVTFASNKDKIALVMKALTNPFFYKMEEGAKQYAKENRLKLEVFGTERETMIKEQIAIVQSLISQEYGAIVIAPADSEKLIPVCQQALEQGIIVVNIDNPLHRPTIKKLGLEIPFVGSDNRHGASMVGSFIRKRLGGNGRVIIIEGIREAENAKLRKQGFVEGLQNIEVIESKSAHWHQDEAFSLVSELLDKHGKVDAILCANDNMALGALQAVDFKGWSKEILIGGYDNIEAVRQAIQNGTIHATIEQHPELMGEYGVSLAAQALAGKNIPETSTTPLDLVTSDLFGKKMAISVSNLSNPFFSLLAKGAKDQAEIFGIDLQVIDEKDQDDGQISNIITSVDANVSALIVNPVNSDTISLAIEYANEAKIPVFTVDRSISGGKVINSIESDNVTGGRLAARLIAKYLGGKGRVVEIEGVPGASATTERGKGFNDELRKYPEINVVTRESGFFNEKNAKEIIDRLLSNNFKFEAIFAHNDSMILGAAKTLHASGKPIPVLVGFDGIPDALDAIDEGLITATICQVPKEMGRLSVINAVKFLSGEEVGNLTLVNLRAKEK